MPALFDNDRPRLWVLALLAAIWLAAGFGLVQLSAAPTRDLTLTNAPTPPPQHPRAQSNSPTRRATTAPQPSAKTGGTAAPSSDTQATAEPQAARAGARATSTSSAAGTSAAAATPTSAGTSAAAAPRLRFVQRNVAYLRCDGAQVRRGRFPCPRDRALEQRVWRVLQTAAQCPGIQALPAGELRLDWKPGRAVRLSAWEERAAGRRRQRRSSWLRCLSPSLQDVQSRIRARRLIVAFRFALQ